MNNCRPEEGIFPSEGNMLRFTEGTMVLAIVCRPVAGDQCILTVAFTVDGEAVLPDNPHSLTGQPCSKLGLAQAWEPYHDRMTAWLKDRDDAMRQQGIRLMAKALSEFLRRGIDIPL